jgi:murein L,D-transpeptidase YafK
MATWLSLMIGCALASTPAQSADSEGLTRMKTLAHQAGVSWPMRQVWVHIDKSDRTLVLRAGDTVVQTYTVALGTVPSGDKTREGDRKTPTGTFRVVTRNPQSNFHLFLGISYPNAEDAERGVKAKLISGEQAQAIQAAETEGRPMWSTKLGGAIGIHGGGVGIDWTWGCVAVEDSEIEELWTVVRHGTKVVIAE